MSLKGKTLFITGASRGIGLAIGLRAARDGANVAIAAKTDTPHPKLPGTIHSAASEIAKAGGRALPLVVDVRDEESVKSAIARTAEVLGGIDIVVNNASAISLAPIAATEMKRFDLMHQVNARGTFLVSKSSDFSNNAPRLSDGRDECVARSGCRRLKKRLRRKNSRVRFQQRDDASTIGFCLRICLTMSARRLFRLPLTTPLVSVELGAHWSSPTDLRRATKRGCVRKFA
jgi:short chain dehydrogenase